MRRKARGKKKTRNYSRQRIGILTELDDDDGPAPELVVLSSMSIEVVFVVEEFDSASQIRIVRSTPHEMTFLRAEE